MRKLTIFTLGIALSAGLLAGCSGQGGPSKNNPTTTTGTGALVTDDASPHPRLLIRPSDLPGLRQQFNANGPMTQGLRNLKKMVDFRVKTIGKFDTPNPQVVQDPAACKNMVSAPDPFNPALTVKVYPLCDWGHFQATNDAVDQYAMFYAFWYLLEQKEEDAQMARTITMWVANQAVQGFDDTKPYRAYSYSWKNRGSESEALPLAFDWAYPAFSQADKETLHAVFVMWADAITHGSFGSSLWLDLKGNVANLLDANELLDIQSHPEHMQNYPVTERRRARWGMNNYVSGGTKNLFLMVNAMRGLDFQPVSFAAPSPSQAQIYNKLADYNAVLEGGALARLYAYFTQNTGGLAPEGPYGYGLITMRNYLLLRSAMFTVSSMGLYAPPPPLDQLTELPAWENGLDGFLAGLANTPSGDKVHWPYSYYHVANLFQQDTDILAVGLDNVMYGWAVYHNFLKGDASHLKNYMKALWGSTYAAFGGEGQLYKKINSDSMNYYAGMSSLRPVLMYLAFNNDFNPLDPQALPDPRSQGDVPLNYLDPSLGRVIARNQFGPNGSALHSNCSWATIDHMGVGEISGFSGVRKGDYYTKVVSGYSQNLEEDKASYNNTLAILMDSNYPSGTNISQLLFDSGTQLPGEPGSTVSLEKDFTYSQCDTTNLYGHNSTNTPDFLLQKYASNGSLLDEVTHASRSLVWLKPQDPGKSDYVIIYDRANTKQAGLFKRFTLTLYPKPPQPNPPLPCPYPCLAGKTLTSVTQTGQQKFFMQNLLPSSSLVSVVDLPGEKHGSSDWAPGYEAIMSFEGNYPPVITWPKIFQVDSVANGPAPAEVQFLDVVQASDNNGTPQTPAFVVKSSAGTAFEGVQLGGMVVLFRKNIAAPLPDAAAFTLTYTSPQAAQGHLLTSLEPDTIYHYSKNGNTLVFSPAGNQQATTNSEGVLILGSVLSPG